MAASISASLSASDFSELSEVSAFSASAFSAAILSASAFSAAAFSAAAFSAAILSASAFSAARRSSSSLAASAASASFLFLLLKNSNIKSLSYTFSTDYAFFIAFSSILSSIRLTETNADTPFSCIVIP